MSKAKVLPEIKLRAVKNYLSGKGSLVTISQTAGVDPSTLDGWVMRYKAEGSSCFFPNGKNKAYSQEAKIQAVEAYLSGKGSLKTICEKYQISSTRADGRAPGALHRRTSPGYSCPGPGPWPLR